MAVATSARRVLCRLASSRPLLGSSSSDHFSNERVDTQIPNFSTSGERVAHGRHEEKPSSSWFQKLKGFWGGQSSDTKTLPKPTQFAPEHDFTFEKFADELKKAAQFGKLTQFGRGLPRGGETSVIGSLNRQETILRKLASHGSDPQKRIDVASQCGCSVRDVEDVLAKYEWAKEANNRMMMLKEEGKPLPKSFEEVETMMRGRWKASASVNLADRGQQSRNSPCPCGSGKKYKRCCGVS